MGTQLSSPKGAQPPILAISVVAKRLDGLRCHLVWRYGPRLRRLCVRWGPSSPPQKKGHSPRPIFCPCLLWPNGWMDQDATWYGGKPRPRRRCVRWGRSSPFLDTAPVFAPCLCVCCDHGRPSQLLLSSYLWSPYVIGQAIYVFILSFVLLLLSSFPRLISVVADWMSAILLHMVWP